MSRWPMVSLREVLTQYKDYIDAPEPKQYPKLSVRLYGKGVMLDTPADGRELKMKRHQVAKAGQVILSEIWGKKGAIGFVPPEGDGALCTSHFFLFDVNRDRLDPRWLGWIFKANYLEPQLGAEAKGTTGYAAVRPAHLLPAMIPLPPLPQQRRIIAKIGKVADRIAEANRLRLLADRERCAFQAATISETIDRPGINGTLKDVLLTRPRNGWSMKCGADDGIAVLGLGAITGFRYRPDQIKRTSEPTDANAHYWLKPGDLLISRSNTAELVGHAAIYDGTPSPCIYPDLMMRLLVDPRKAEPKFVHYVLQSRTARDFIKAHAKGTSPTMKKISQGVVEAIPFPLACRLADQRKIVLRLDCLSAAISSVAADQKGTAKEIEGLLPSVLDRAFNGLL